MRLLTFVRKAARRPRPPWSRPLLEQLEDRWCPAGYTVTDLGTLDGNGSAAHAVNAANQVVGSTASQAYLWTPGATDGVPSNPQMKPLAGLTSGQSFALAINDNGWVLGGSDTGTF